MNEVFRGRISLFGREGVGHGYAGGEELEFYFGCEELWPHFPGLDDGPCGIFVR